jgi:hypothetical protein
LTSSRLWASKIAKPNPKYPARYPQTGTQRCRTILGRFRRVSTTIQNFKTVRYAKEICQGKRQNPKDTGPTHALSQVRCRTTRKHPLSHPNLPAEHCLGSQGAKRETPQPPRATEDKQIKDILYFLLHNNASGLEIGLSGRISAGFQWGNPQNRPSCRPKVRF